MNHIVVHLCGSLTHDLKLLLLFRLNVHTDIQTSGIHVILLELTVINNCLMECLIVRLRDLSIPRIISVVAAVEHVHNLNHARPASDPSFSSRVFLCELILQLVIGCND